MAERFDGKVAFITGASAGIGAEVARLMAQEGAKVAICARRQDKLDDVAEVIRKEGGEALALVCDVCDRASIDEAVARTIEHFGKLDIVLANAGFGVNGPFQRLRTEDYRRQFETNFFGVVDTAYATVPHLTETQGTFAVVSSVLGRMGAPATSAYCASKFALCGWAESLYFDLADQGVAVVCIDPGVVESEFRWKDNRGRIVSETDPAPDWLRVPTDRAAREILAAIHKRKPEAVITGHGKIVCFIARHFPRTMRFMLRRSSRGRVEKIAEAKRGT